VAVTINCKQLKERTKLFALRVIRLIRALPQNAEARVIGNQLLRSATAVGANYRAACLARSTADFISKMGIVLEEADESVFWLELLSDAGIAKQQRLADLLQEAKELAAIFAASKITVAKKTKQAAAKTT